MRLRFGLLAAPEVVALAAVGTEEAHAADHRSSRSPALGRQIVRLIGRRRLDVLFEVVDARVPGGAMRFRLRLGDCLAVGVDDPARRPDEAERTEQLRELGYLR